MPDPEEKQTDEHSDEERINSLFHRLWTKAAGTVSYDKEQWKQLQQLLYKKGVIDC